MKFRIEEEIIRTYLAETKAESKENPKSESIHMPPSLVKTLR